MNLTIIGTGYVGLVTGVCFAETGNMVTCIDVDKNKIETLRSGHSTIYEEKLEELIKNNLKRKRLFFSTDINDSLNVSDLVFIAVGTPKSSSGSTDLSALISCVKQIASNISKDLIVVVKSTVPIGTNDFIERIICDKLIMRKKDLKVEVVSNPEFLKEGIAVRDFTQPDRIIIGCENDKTKSILTNLYRPFIGNTLEKLIFMNRNSAEMTKYAANCMLASRISFMNELSQLCETLNADIKSVKLGIGSDKRIGPNFLTVGPGYGGSCFPKDISSLNSTACDLGLKLPLLSSIKKSNRLHKQYLIDNILTQLGSIKNKIIAIWGLSFKANTDDIRESPAIDFVLNLLSKGAKLYVHDPKAMTKFRQLFPPTKNLKYHDIKENCLNSAIALCILTDWQEYKEINWQEVQSRFESKEIFDLRNIYHPSELINQGFKYRGIGRPGLKNNKRGFICNKYTIDINSSHEKPWI